MARIVDLSGQRFGSLLVTGRAPKKTYNTAAIWECKCICGAVLGVSGQSLRSGNTKSCGCRKQASEVIGRPWERQTELAWCAGFFDGEGCFYVQTSGEYKWTRIAISQQHRVVLERFKAALGGLGNIHIGRKVACQDGTVNQHWQYSISKFGDVQFAMACMWKFLSPVKREQAKAKFKEMQAYNA